MKKLFIVVNVDWFFLSHRLPIALEAKKFGYLVAVLAADTGFSKEIESHGIDFINVPFKRSGTNIAYELKCINILRNIYIKHKPDLVHHVTIKVAIYGSIAAKLSSVKGVVNAISGLGYNFTSGKNGLTKKILFFLMKFSFKQNNIQFIFQNEDDICLFKSLKLVEDKQITLIKGSGVNLEYFAEANFPISEKVIVLLAARMLYDKGVVEFIDAAKALKNNLNDKASFLIAGDIDSENLSCIPKEVLMSLIDAPYISWIGHQKDVNKLLKESHIIVLPSYREGLPKSLIEAAAVGRPIITTAVPGCKECVIEGYNGFLVPAMDYQSLSKAMEKLILNPMLQLEMGKNSRKLAEKEFSIENVLEKTLNIYKQISEY